MLKKDSIHSLDSSDGQVPCNANSFLAPENVKVLDDHISGYIWKKGAKGLVQTWRKRWFVVRKGSKIIEYYRNIPSLSSSTSEPLGSIDVLNITQVAASDPTINNNPKKKEFHFQIYTPNRTYFLYATEEEDMHKWISVLSQLHARFKQAEKEKEEQLSAKPKSGQLLINIIEAKDLNLSVEKGHLGVYCILSVDKQAVRTQVVNHFSHIQWNESCFFDITDFEPSKKKDVLITVWVQDSSQSGGHCVGNLVIPVLSLLNNEKDDQSYKLQSTETSRSVGSLHLKFRFTRTEEKITKEHFEMLKVIGRGNFGKVMQVRKKDTGRIYAMKVIKKDTVIAADAVQHTLSETHVLRRVNHPFIVNLKYSFQTVDKLYIVMDYLSGGELYHHLSSVDRFPEDLARFYAAEIVEAIGYLHDNNIIYRDLKPENLLLDISGHICLTDFGLVKELLSPTDYTLTFCGSPEYLAPEILLGRAYNKDVDWWSFGTFLYEMLEGLPPFYDEDINLMNKKILGAPLYFSDHFSSEAKSLLRALLQRDPKLRLGQGKQDHLDIKLHPFFRTIDWDKLSRKEIDPLFKPHLKSEEDVRYFDPEFTSQTPSDTPVSRPRFLHPNNSGEDLFAGFTYVSSSFEQQIERRRKLKSNLTNNDLDNHHNVVCNINNQITEEPKFDFDTTSSPTLINVNNM